MTAFAMVFPGQGAQTVGMVDALAADFPQIKRRYAQASEILKFDLWALVTDGPREVLNQSEHTQPALLAASVATWDIWCALGGHRPSLVAGHSFGEYSALVCADALDFEAAVGLVAARGRLMQDAVRPPLRGAMAAVLGLDAEVLEAVCAQAAGDDIVACANLNAPGQVVISGTAEAVARAAELAKARGAKKVIPLTVSVAAHCALMAPAAIHFAELVAAIALRPPQIPVIHNVDATAHPVPADIRHALVAQLAKPVRWQATIEYFARAGVTQVVECGPGKVLGPLIKRCAPDLTTLPLGSPAELRAALDAGLKDL